MSHFQNYIFISNVLLLIITFWWDFILIKNNFQLLLLHLDELYNNHNAKEFLRNILNNIFFLHFAINAGTPSVVKITTNIFVVRVIYINCRYEIYRNKHPFLKCTFALIKYNYHKSFSHTHTVCNAVQAVNLWD